MNQRRMIRLLRRYLDGTASPDERARVDKWYDALPEAGAASQSGLLPPEGAAGLKEAMYLHIRTVLDNGAGTRVVPLYRRTPFRIAAAACLLVLIAGTAYWLLQRGPGQKQVIVQTTVPDVPAPDRPRATLTLGDGTRIGLDTATAGTLAQQNGTRITRDAQGRIEYHKGQSDQVMYNTLFNPRGSQNTLITLSDGTRVWLNAESSLHYPAAFPGTSREVAITGEAYFEVAPDAKRPFIVRKGATSVRVLGTRFNVNAYDDEEAIKTTLLEGSVKVSNGPNSRLLKPGEQAAIRNPGNPSILQIMVQTADTSAVTAWKNGKFIFGEKTDIQTIMRQISRWYDVDVGYQGVVPVHFGGSMSRQISVAGLLDKLALTGEVSFTIQGRKIMVSPK